jgi:isopenicillin N synthase-like dioxygenase
MLFIRPKRKKTTMTKLRLVKNFVIKNADMKNPNWAGIVIESFKETGFAVIRNHGIPVNMIDAAYTQWADFFRTENKFRYQAKDNGNGYFPVGTENAKGYSVKDVKEFYHLFYPFDRVPLGISITTMQSLSYKLMEIARQILFVLQSEIPKDLAKVQGESLHHMVKSSSSTLLRILHYPPLPDDIEKGAVRAAPHEDINLITLLIAATQPGLQVMGLDGQWQDIDCEPGSIVVNVGDMLQKATNGLLKSTPHRVVNPTGPNVSRYSMPLFVHPRNECVISENLTAGQYLEERLLEIGLKK